MSEQQRGRRAIEAGPTGKTVAVNLARFRKQKQLTTRQLSGLLERNGRPIPASGITRMEKAERQVTADELVALAVALDVNPAMLLLPSTVDGDIEISGGGQVPAAKAWDWFRKDMPLRTPEGDDGSAIVAFRLNLPQGIRKFNITNAAGRRAALEADDGGADG
ncbi:helix-turn-helix domain-containing protein [Streptomyces flavidovirens]|uniref:Helix-turn-helix domain-containing protein n=1 Tax=Streptomyces flavidovirens TaxID=67298 RepID=A0ABW6R940_9ACTN